MDNLTYTYRIARILVDPKFGEFGKFAKILIAKII